MLSVGRSENKKDKVMKSIFFKRPILRLMAMMFLLLFLFAGCEGDGPGEVDDLWYHLFDPEYSMEVVSSPPYFTTENPVEITVTVHPRESGTGRFWISGNHPDGTANGTLLSPETGEVGRLFSSVVLEAGLPTRLIWQIQLNEINESLPQKVRFSFEAGFDSVLVDSTMYPIGAQELVHEFGSGYGTSIGTLFHLYPEE